MTNILPLAKVIDLSPQQRLVYDYLATGRRLTRQVAINTLNVQEVTTRIAELRKMGLDIKGEWKRDFGNTKYKSYWLEV